MVLEKSRPKDDSDNEDIEDKKEDPSEQHVGVGKQNKKPAEPRVEANIQPKKLEKVFDDVRKSKESICDNIASNYLM